MEEGKGVLPLKGVRVLELGAGTGLVSLCCSLLGASSVLATDFEASPSIDTNKIYMHLFF
ncbi:unnamed protein product [Choristocarpus tenellus]